MFLLHVAVPLDLIALIGGLALYIWAIRTQGAGTGLAKVFGIIISIIAILEILCSIYGGIRFWQFRHDHRMIMQMPMPGMPMPGSMPRPMQPGMGNMPQPGPSQ